MTNLDDNKNLFAQGDKKGAIKKLASSLRTIGNDIDAWLLLCEVIGDTEKKRACYKQVLKLFPNNSLALNGLRKLEVVTPLPAENFSSSFQDMQPRNQYDPRHQTTSETNFVTSNQQKQRTEYKSKPEFPKEEVPPHASKMSFVSYVVLGIIILCLIVSLGQCASGSQDLATPIATADPQEQAAIDAVKNQDTPIASNMSESIAVVLVIIENDGHTQSIDGWYVSRGSGYYSVKFYFYLDGSREFAEWWYYPDTKFVIPKNDWAFIFMGD